MTLHPYAALGIAIVSEVIATLSIKASDGFTRVPFTAIVLAGYGVAFYLLAYVVKTIPVGVAYAVWTGVGVALVVGFSAVVYRQLPDAPALIGLALIVAGVLVIHLFSKVAVH